jgi:hypothetical protein
MKPEVVLHALLAIWGELPALVGADWPKVLPRLEALLDRLKATGDPDLTADLVLALRAYPVARARPRAAAAARVGRSPGDDAFIRSLDSDPPNDSRPVRVSRDGS